MEPVHSGCFCRSQCNNNNFLNMNYSLFWLLIFQYERKGLFVWHMKAGERKYPFDTLLYPVANRFEWISANEIALGFGDGLMKLWKIDEGTANDSHFEHDVSFKIRKRFTRCHDYYQFFHFGSMVLQLCDHFVFHLMKGGITDLKWNQTTKYLASSSRDSWIKVIFPFLILLVRNWKNGRR